MGISPRDAAAAAAFARASSGASKLDLGASIPAKTLVEHKAEDGTNNISGKGRNIIHLMSAAEGNSQFCFPEILNVSRE